MPPSCLQTAFTVPLRHVDGFPALGLLWGLRPLLMRSPVALVIPKEAPAGFPGSDNNPLLVLGPDSTPDGFGSVATTAMPTD